MELFRYSKKCHNESLVARGNIRIGTLHDFRNQEHKRGIADPMEGKKSVRHFIGSATLGDGTIHDEANDAYGLIKCDVKNAVFLKDVVFQKNFDESDCFIFCTSYKYSKEVMDQFDGADSCVRIHDISRFVSRLTEALSSRGYPILPPSIVKVIYQGRIEDWNSKNNWGAHPAHIKEVEFEPQKEVRIIWSLKEKALIEPVILEESDLIKFCELMDTPS